jgi:hypothetical protein
VTAEAQEQAPKVLLSASLWADDAAEVERIALEEDRSLSAVIRRVVHLGLQAVAE